ncbi:SDR family oxidoreductase, partial [Nonlabens ulvanivorans]|uniref:SDR family oxidoreductase n=1 Tax=Nonlabens ulvanivorans TaxID=906888 RepID=UPI0032994D70
TKAMDEGYGIDMTILKEKRDIKIREVLIEATLEAINRSMAIEFATSQITCNCIQAGVTDTDSLKRIPMYEALKKMSLKRNPNHRLTQPEDVANVVYLLALKESQWITGNVIKVDGGESLQ